MNAILQSVTKTGRLLVVEEANEFAGVASYVSARVAESRFSDLSGPVMRLTTGDTPFPAGRELERSMLVTSDRIVEAIAQLTSPTNR